MRLPSDVPDVRRAVELLRDAQALLADPSSWTQHADPVQSVVRHRSGADEGPWTVTDALYHLAYPPDLRSPGAYSEASWLLVEAAAMDSSWSGPRGRVDAWNDHPDRTHGDVLRALADAETLGRRFVERHATEQAPVTGRHVLTVEPLPGLLRGGGLDGLAPSPHMGWCACGWSAGPDSRGEVRSQHRAHLAHRLHVSDDAEEVTGPGVPSRFWAKVDIGDCWQWTGATDRGYAKFFIHGRTRRAHRWIYEQLVGPIDPGLVIDHLCRNRGCVNPDHLEPVRQQTNVSRGAAALTKARCVRDHDLLDEANTYSVTGGRGCRSCRRDRDRDRKRGSRERSQQLPDVRGEAVGPSGKRPRRLPGAVEPLTTQTADGGLTPVVRRPSPETPRGSVTRWNTRTT